MNREVTEYETDHVESGRHDVRYVRKPCERGGAQGLPQGQEGHLVPQQGPDRDRECVLFDARTITEEDIPEADLRAAIEPTGYKVLGYKEEPYQKKGLFGWLSK